MYLLSHLRGKTHQEALKRNNNGTTMAKEEIVSSLALISYYVAFRSVMTKLKFQKIVIFQILLLVHLMSFGIVRWHDCHKSHDILKWWI